MANILKLKKSSTELDLIAAAGAGFRTQTWYPKATEIRYRDIPPYLSEEFDILLDCTSHDDLAAKMQALDQMRIWADMFWRGIIPNATWLHCKMNNETGERRALVKKIDVEWRSNEIDVAGYAAANDALLRLTIERHPYWERTAFVDHGSQGGREGASVMLDYSTTDPVGDVAARGCFYFYNGSVVPAYTLERFWAGFRSTKFGTPANFIYLWEIEDPDTVRNVNETLAPANDGVVDASPGGGGNTMVEADFHTAGSGTLVKLWTGAVKDYTANYTDQLGRFLWLLRARVDGASTFEVHLRWGFEQMADADFIRGPTVVVDSNLLYNTYEMGESQIPLTGTQIEPYDSVFGIPARVAEAAVQIWAERTNGVGSLFLDCLMPIPLDEGWLVAKNVGMVWQANPPYQYVKSFYTPHDRMVAWRTISTTGIYDLPVVSHHNFNYPPGDGRIIASWARASSCNLTDELVFYYRAISRWANLRGAE